MEKVQFPKTESGFMSLSLHSRLVFKGYRKALTADDLWELHPRDVSRVNVPRFEKAWNYELDKTNWYGISSRVPFFLTLYGLLVNLSILQKHFSKAI